MNTRTKLLTASGGVLLLAGVGGALALWSDSTSGDNLMAATGHLSVDITGQDSYIFDISDNCAPSINATTNAVIWNHCNPNGTPAGTPQLLDRDANGNLTQDTTSTEYITQPSTAFKMVPGDKIRIAAPVKVDLFGQNLAAQLNATLDTSTLASIGVDPSNPSLGPEFTVTPVGVFAAAKAGVTVTDAQSVVSNATGNTTYNFVSATASTASQYVYVVVEVDYADISNQDTDGANSMNATASTTDLMDVDTLSVLRNINVTLTQVRN